MLWSRAGPAIHHPPEARPGTVRGARHLDRPAAGVALGVGDRFLGDAPEFPLLREREPAGGLGAEDDLDAAAAVYPLQEGLENRDQVLAVGDVGPEVIERVSDLTHDPADVLAQV